MFERLTWIEQRLFDALALALVLFYAYSAVLEPAATSRDVYLPAGAEWTDAWSGTAHPGGQTVSAATPIQRIPLFLKDGCTLPIHTSKRL